MRKVPEFNFRAFNAATDVLRDHGHEVFNPAERDIARGFDPTGLTGNEDLNDGTYRFSLREALGDDVAWICEKADAICLLPGWEHSSGARAEMTLAAALGLKAGYLGDFLRGTLRDAAEILALPAQPTVVREGETATFLPGGEIHISRPLIGFGGYAFSGKDAAVDTLVEQGFERTYMSKPLEQALLALNPRIAFEGAQSKSWTGSRTWKPSSLAHGSSMLYADLHTKVGYEASKRNPEVRRLLQRLGTEVGRKLFGENVWVDKMRTEVSEVLNAGGKIAVTGIRFQDEANAIRELGGRLIWVSRPGYGPVNGHSSDNTLGPDDFDEVIVNGGTLDDLRLAVSAVVTL